MERGFSTGMGLENRQLSFSSLTPESHRLCVRALSIKLSSSSFATFSTFCSHRRRLVWSLIPVVLPLSSLHQNWVLLFSQPIHGSALSTQDKTEQPLRHKNTRLCSHYIQLKPSSNLAPTLLEVLTGFGAYPASCTKHVICLSWIWLFWQSNFQVSCKSESKWKMREQYEEIH